MRIRLGRLFMEVAWVRLPKDIKLDDYTGTEGYYEEADDVPR